MPSSEKKKKKKTSNDGVSEGLKRLYSYSGITILFLLVLLFSIFLFYHYKRSLEPSFISLYSTITRTHTDADADADTDTDTVTDTFKVLEFNASSSPSSPSPSAATTPPLVQDNGNADESISITRPQSIPLLSPTSNTSHTNKKEDSPPPSNDDDNNNVNAGIERELRECDLYMGKWVRDESYPVYEPGSCPYVDEAFDCQPNGRPDSLYLNWRWKPYGCNLPRFNATDFLVRLRGKRLMLVGDSMNRNQFESFLCILRQALPDKSRMFEVHGHKITKGRGYYVFKFLDYNCTIQFVRSHFLVREGIRINARGNSNPTLSIDRIDKTASRWKKADILVFNTGHWWTHGKTARGKNYYKEGDYIYPTFDAFEAYRRALKTWGNWIDKNINQAKQLVFYRGYSSAHFRGGDWDSGGTCKGEKDPVLSGPIINDYPLKMKMVEEVISEMQVPVILLNVTRLTNFRKDGHPSIYGKNTTDRRSRRQDCSHWCLPGVPDAWNELIYVHLLRRK